MKCEQCRKQPVQDSLWDKVRLWLMHHLFSLDITDLSQDKYIQGFSDGYKQGRLHMRKDTAKLVKELWGIDI